VLATPGRSLDAPAPGTGWHEHPAGFGGLRGNRDPRTDLVVEAGHRQPGVVDLEQQAAAGSTASMATLSERRGFMYGYLVR